MIELWVEKYRPKTAGEYVFRDDNQRKQINTWIKDKSIPHLLLSGSPGIGKSGGRVPLFCLPHLFSSPVGRPPPPPFPLAPLSPPAGRPGAGRGGYPEIHT